MVFWYHGLYQWMFRKKINKKSHTHIIFWFSKTLRGTCLIVVLCLTLSHTWQQGVWCFRCCLQPGSHPQFAATFSLILLQPFPRMQVSSVLPFCLIAPPVSAPEPPSSALPVSALDPPAQTPPLLPHHPPPDNNAVETAHNRHQEWCLISGCFRFVL